ncbi:MAG: hypothetical protein J6R40_04910 [Clostridia bacterium]|nr:hypothetical protein [Clostridia bacterium]
MKRICFPFSDFISSVKPLGRTYSDSQSLRFSFSASGVEFKFSGKRVRLHFGDCTAPAPIYVRLMADEKAQKCFLLGKDNVLDYDFEADGEHRVSLVRLSAGDVSIPLIKIECIGEMPALLPPPPQKPRKMLFLGDSLTCGYGTEGVDEPAYFTYDEDATHSYAYITAKALDADYQLVSISGQGIVCCYNGERGILFEEFFRFCGRDNRAPYDFSAFDADVVVVNGSTNDGFSGIVSEEQIYEGAKSLLLQIREVYPNAEIIWFYGLMSDKFNGALQRLIEDMRATDKHMHYLSTVPVGGREGEVGANGHPSYKGQMRGAKELTAYIKEVMKW